MSCRALRQVTQVPHVVKQERRAGHGDQGGKYPQRSAPTGIIANMTALVAEVSRPSMSGAT